MKIAIQKSGRLYENSIELLKECGIAITPSKNQLRVVAANFDLEVFFLRDDDIPQYVADKVADIGIVGQNVLIESGLDVATLATLGFGKCRLSIAVGKTEKYNGIEDLQNKKIATSYPKILQSHLTKNKINADIHVISGSVEIAPKIGLADAICDLVSSGSTLFMNELKEVETILHSEAVLIANHQLTDAERMIVNKLLFRIESVKKAKSYKYILLNAPNDKLEEICKILPGMRSPTILPLAEGNWSSVHSVVQEDEFWNYIEQLKANGAEGILVVPIEKMIL